MLTCTLIYFLKFVVAKTLYDLAQALLWQKFTVVVYMYMYPLKNEYHQKIDRLLEASNKNCTS